MQVIAIHFVPYVSMTRPNIAPPDHLHQRSQCMNHKNVWNSHEEQLRGEDPRDIRRREVRQEFCLVVRLKKTHATKGETSHSIHHPLPTTSRHQNFETWKENSRIQPPKSRKQRKPTTNDTRPTLRGAILRKLCALLGVTHRACF